MTIFNLRWVVMETSVNTALSDVLIGVAPPKESGRHRILDRVDSLPETFVNPQDLEAFRPLSRPDLGSSRLASPAVV